MSTETATQTSVTQPGIGNDPELPPLPAAWRSLGRAFVATARRMGSQPAVSDSTGVHLSYRQTLLRALALGRALARTIQSGPSVGLMLPPTAPAVVANLALTLWGKRPINLNYTASQEALDSTVEQAELRDILTAQKMLDKVSVRPQGNLILLEDLAKQVSWRDKLWAAAVATVWPQSMLGWLLPGLRHEDLEAPATVIFTSGSTGEPKGVVLTHRNVLSNAHQIRSQVEIGPGDTVLGILPLFHSFGSTVTLWTAMCCGCHGVYHHNPLEARTIGKLCGQHGVTIILATPTFVRSYLKKCQAEDFAKVRLLILGAEKLSAPLADQIRETWGIEPLEGYGCTETGPVASVNFPGELRKPDGRTIPGNRPGTVGRPLPGTWVKTVDIESGADQPIGTEGVVCVQGPQVMQGYLNRPEATAEVLKDGWYWTGDLGSVDADGFLSITDRLNRFSKIGGEMVPHRSVESALLEAAGTHEPVAAVTSVPDPKRGERLIVLYAPEFPLSPEAAVQQLNQKNLPKLWLPATDDFLPVEAIPVLGSGKLDLKRLRDVARNRIGS